MDTKPHIGIKLYRFIRNEAVLPGDDLRDRVDPLLLKLNPQIIEGHKLPNEIYPNPVAKLPGQLAARAKEFVGGRRLASTANAFADTLKCGVKVITYPFDQNRACARHEKTVLERAIRAREAYEEEKAARLADYYDLPRPVASEQLAPN